MGGKVGLKGTDGQIGRARELGAEEISPIRAMEALVRLFWLIISEPLMNVRVLTSDYPMGKRVCEQAILQVSKSGDNGRDWGERVTVETIYSPHDPTSAVDTKNFCCFIKEKGAELILFCGGDGTARDVVGAVGEELPILGVPSGVKMHSAVFSNTPSDAGEAVIAFMKGNASLESREVVDLDEDAYRDGEIRTTLFGYAMVPVTTTLQGCKNVVSGVDDTADRRSIAEGLRLFMGYHPGSYILGAGSTLKDIGEYIGVSLTPLGFDVVLVENDGSIELVGEDVNEEGILSLMKSIDRDRRFLVITPIGAQGFILGRGTQVVSNRVLDSIPSENVIIVATPGKLAITPTLKVDVGVLSDRFRGFIEVMIGYQRFALKKVE